VRAMRDAVPIPVTVKHRIGLDDREEYAFVRDFVGAVHEAGCDIFIVHARNAVLKGLSPKENREIPPLRYEIVHQLKRDFPDVTIVINGGFTDWDAIERELQSVDGVMLGRVAYHDPYMLAEADWRIFGEPAPPRSRMQVIEALIPYAAQQLAHGVQLRAITRHVLGLYHGRSGGRHFRRILSDAGRLKRGDLRVFDEALAAVEPVAA